MKYEHKYASHQVPAPVITEASMAIEDAAGELTVTHALVSDMCGKIEGLADLRRQLTERPGSMDPKAWMSRIDALDALASAIDARLKDSIILLYAIIDKNNEDDAAARKAA
jgi:hypothetical protein